MTTIEDVSRTVHAVLEEARADGYKIARQLLSISLNPFPDGTHEHEYWNAGWHAAIRDAQNLATR